MDLIWKYKQEAPPPQYYHIKKKKKGNQTSKIEVMGVTKTNKSNKTSSTTLKPPKVRVLFNQLKI